VTRFTMPNPLLPWRMDKRLGPQSEIRKEPKGLPRTMERRSRVRATPEAIGRLRKIATATGKVGWLQNQPLPSMRSALDGVFGPLGPGQFLTPGADTHAHGQCPRGSSVFSR
jgi:hypothetical protein